MRSGFICGALLTLAACTAHPPDLPAGGRAYQLMSAPAPQQPAAPYVIGPLDTLTIRVFQEPDLSYEEIAVGADGMISLPLIGSVPASGQTSAQLESTLTQKLNSQYLKNAQVTVGIVNAVSRKFTVEGAITKPGIYPAVGPMTLIDAIAAAEGPVRTAKLDQIIVFRQIDGERAGAVFDIASIRRGEADDPAILPGDQIIVGSSRAKAAFRDFLTAAPLFGVFTRF